MGLKEPLPQKSLKFLTVSRPAVIDLILSKMGRGDIKDLDDVKTLLTIYPTPSSEILKALKKANVPEVYKEIFPKAREAILNLARKMDIHPQPSPPEGPLPLR